MPVSTRSQFFSQDQDQDQAQVPSSIRNLNPHHGLKEKLKSLTLLYEQHKLAYSTAGPARDPSGNVNTLQVKQEEVDNKLEPTTGTTSTTTEQAVMRENSNSNSNLNPNQNQIPIPSSTVTKTYIPPHPPPNPNPKPSLSPVDEEEAKENAGNNGLDRIVGFSCPRRPPVSTTVSRKLSLGSQTDTLAGGARMARWDHQDPDPVGVLRPPPPPSSSTAQMAATARALFSKEDLLSGMNNRIRVFVRLRPMMKREKETGARCCVKIINRRDVYLTEFASEHDYLRLKRLRGRHFTFDASFPENASQQEVYSTTTSELVEDVLQGRNGSVFCYGATGAGKTYTMLGAVESPGVMVLAIKDLFTKIRQRSFDGNHVVHLSYLEVYNETVRDLLSPGRPLILREDKQGIVAAGLTQYRAYSTDEVMSLLLQGNKNRTTEPTRANETSSRSHAILQVMVEYRTRDASSTNIVSRIGKLSLIDLAGSERALATDQRTVRSIEGANINRSLLALSSCINALVEGKKHIPYRNSKLTQLLKDSLGGACNTVMIANISPSNAAFGETQNTLHWADRAKEIRNKIYEANTEIITESETDKAKLLLEVQKENRELRVQLARQQQKLLTLQTQSLAANTSSSPAAPSSVTPHMSPPSSAKPSAKRKPRTSSLAGEGNCNTPESTRKVKGAEETIRELKQAMKRLEAEMERMKTDHRLQMKKKDDIISELSKKATGEMGVVGGGGEGMKMIVTRASVRPKVNPSTIQGHGEVKTAKHRFQSPAPTAKKRSFWDITTANSPSITTVNGRKTRSHLTLVEGSAPPRSMLLQPGFARQRFLAP